LQPIRAVSNATHFKREGDSGWVIPCEPGEAGAVAMNWRQVEKQDKIRKPPVTEDDYVKSVLQIRSSVCLDDLKKYELWTKEHGIN
jgi:hypothetical protein